LKNTKSAFLLAPAWFVFTTVLLCLPGSVLPKENWFDKIWLDKWVHISLFSVMVFLWCWLLSYTAKNKNKSFLQIFFYCCLYGIAMEFVQKYFIPNRSFDVKDMLADAIGGAFGWLASVKVFIKK
jgi:VanZ family protein